MDKLNALSYAYHYQSLDSARHYAQRAFDASAHYADGRAEALNNLAFVCMARMQYAEAKRLLDQIPSTTDNQLELLVGYIQQMRLCQRMSSNREFYDQREQAMNALRRIDEERTRLSSRQLQRLVYAESELAIVNSTYFYYIGLERQSVQALDNMPPELERDTAQFLNYLYNVGAGGIISRETQEEINQVEFDHLMRCYLLASQTGMDYFVANSLEALAEHLTNDGYRQRLMTDNLPVFKYFNPDGLPADSIPLLLAGRSLDLFTAYGDVYQIAGAHRTLATCHLSDGNYVQALEQLQLALSDSIINEAPDLVASIREQLSVAYAAIDDKSESDHHRNIYLNLQEQTRQDRYLEARAGQLEQAAAQLNLLIWAVVGAILLLVLLLLLYALRLRRQKQGRGNDSLLQQEDELKEHLAMARMRVERGERLALEQRAKISLVNGITPLIDRIIHETHRLSPESLDYIGELAANIDEQNEVLTHWIQLRQGELSLHVETFPLQQLFDIVGKSRSTFAMKHIKLEVEPTDARVKADKVLTLFMLNTLADNARKFTPEGGTVRISAEASADYVEISVSDTGIGLADDQLAHIFDRNISGGHGFGLLNCKGIIEKYRKMSRLFSVCLLSVESRVGQGSRFFFRLPKGMLRLLLPLLLAVWGAGPSSAYEQPASAYEQPVSAHEHLAQASVFSDSAYFSNVNGLYAQTLDYADSCRQHLNAYFRSLRPSGSDTLLRLGDPSLLPPEIAWLRDSFPVNYNILLSMRNESAVAALALHQWQVYQYNNRIYTQLFKELSADSTLDDYCRKMQQSQTNKQVAIILLVLLFLMILAVVVWQVVVSLGKAARRQQEQQDRLELTRDELARALQEEAALHVSNAVLDNCLSTLKHETMYYPSRIRQLIESGDHESLPEVAAYYRELYGLLGQQAMRQTEHVRLRLKPLAHEVLGDPVLIDYLYDILRRQSGEKTLRASYQPKGEKYVVCTVSLPRLQLTEQQASSLFTPASDHIPYLLCRQIVRDHGEATNRRACAIVAQVQAEGTNIIITLPRGLRVGR